MACGCKEIQPVGNTAAQPKAQQAAKAPFPWLAVFIGAGVGFAGVVAYKKWKK